MVRRALAALISGLAAAITAACVQSQPPTERTGEFPTPAAGETATPRLDYRGMTTRLLTPLGAMIVSARNQSPTGAAHFQTFESQAVPILAELQGLSTPEAITIRATISDIREAWPLRDVAALERARLRLLGVG